MQVVTEKGKIVEIDCDYFADEAVPLEEVKKKCYDEQGQPKCEVWAECYKIYTRRVSE